MPDRNDNDSNSPDQAAFQRALQRAVAGDGEAVGEMLHLCRDYLLLIANQDMDRDVRRKMGASDLVQESMIHAMNHFDRFEGSTKQEFLAWLRGIMRNDARHWQRHFKGVKKRAGEQDVNPDDSRLPGKEPIDLFLTPSTHAVADEEEALLQRAIQRLPRHYQQIVQLRSFEDQSFIDIGRKLDCSADAARKLWSRAILQMQEIMSQERPDK